MLEDSRNIRAVFTTSIVLATIFWFHFLFSFENAADLKFFLGISLPWRFWKWTMTCPNGQCSIRNYQVETDCSKISRIFSSQHPILFKNCIHPNSTSVNKFLFFEDQVQNLFPPCKEKVLRHFTFETFNNETKPIVEDVPCANHTLMEKLSNFHDHRLDISSTVNYTDTEEEETNSYFEVHTYVMTRHEKRHVNKILSRNMVLDNIDDMGLTSKMVLPILTYFLHAGRSAVYYLHAHMDHFLSFCLTEKKTWMLIDPYYLDEFSSLWSGNAQVMLKEHSSVPKMVITQEKGDILFIPPWWIHQTIVHQTKKNLGFNIHFGSTGQISFEVASFVARFFDDTKYFYRNSKNLDKDKFSFTN